MQKHSSNPLAILFLTGGYANQLFQLAYFYTLYIEYKPEVYISNILLSSTFAFLFGITKRDPILFPANIFLQLSFYDLLISFAQKFFGSLDLRFVSDNRPLGVTQLSVNTILLLKGSFHNQLIFTDVVLAFWDSVRKSLDTKFILHTFFDVNNSLVVHLRLGDYLTLPNSQIYSPITPLKILTIIDRLSHVSNYYYVSDSPNLAAAFFDSPYLLPFNFCDLSSNSQEQDLFTLSLFDTIICSNSTFSILSTLISSSRSSPSKKSFFFPKNWFIDKDQNNFYYSSFLQFIPFSSFY